MAEIKITDYPETKEEWAYNRVALHDNGWVVLRDEDGKEEDLIDYCMRQCDLCSDKACPATVYIADQSLDIDYGGYDDVMEYMTEEYARPDCPVWLCYKMGVALAHIREELK